METHNTSAVLIRDGKKILFIINKHRREGLEIPAGHVDGGETPLDAARREAVKEVGGVGIAGKKPFAVFVHPAGKFWKGDKYVASHFHRCHTFFGKVNGKIKAGSDAERVLWLNEGEADKIGVAEWVKTIIEASK